MSSSETIGVQRVFTTREETRRFYDKISRFYDLLAESSEGPMRALGLERLAVQPGEKVLEIGYGTGHCLLDLAKAVGPTGKVFGIDISEGMQRVAMEKLAAAGLSDRVAPGVGDGTRLPYPDESLDCVFTSFTLELFDTPDIPKVLADCRRVLRPGGRMGVVGVSKESEHGAIIHLYEWTHQHFPNLVDCRPIFVRQSLEAAGFRIRVVEKKTMWVPVEIVVAGRE